MKSIEAVIFTVRKANDFINNCAEKPRKYN